jgi:hypothetical protein
MAIKNQTPTPNKIVVERSGVYVKYHDGIRIPVSKSLVRQYVEYMLIANQEITIEVIP